MARKENITIGLPKPVLGAVEKAQVKLYQDSIDAKVRGDAGEAGYSRSQTIELLVLEGLKKHGVDVEW
jgi:hypothetical protein